MKLKVYNLVLLALYFLQIIMFMIFANGGFKAISAGIICIEAIGLVLSFRFEKRPKLFVVFLIFNIICLLINIIMTLVYMQALKQVPIAIVIITLIVTLAILVKIILDCCIKEK